MTKQEEIREGIASQVKLAQGMEHSIPLDPYAIADIIRRYLQSQGVVIKVEKECSHCNGKGFTDRIENGASAVCPVCYGKPKDVAVEPLIKEKG